MTKVASVRLLLALLLIFLCGSAHAETKAPFVVNVYVDFAPLPVSPEGFVEASDKWLRDSVKDIQRQLDGKEFHPSKGIAASKSRYVVVKDREMADVVLTVAARGTSVESLGQRTSMVFFAGVVLADTVPSITVTRWVSMVFSVGTYKKEFLAWHTQKSVLSAGAWSQDARVLAQQAASWVTVNEKRIRELQDERKNSK